MKFLFKTQVNSKTLDLVLLALRVTVAAFMLTHGYPKLIKLFSGGKIAFADPFGLGAAMSLALVVIAEFFCSIFIGLGLGTRLASIPLMVAMFIAAFDVHGSDPFSRKEMALLYLILYVFFLIVGSGKYSLDYLISHKK